MSDKSENAPSSSEKSSESEGEAPYSSDDEKHRYTSEERRDLEVAYPIFQHGCEVHKLPVCYLESHCENKYLIPLALANNITLLVPCQNLLGRV